MSNPTVLARPPITEALVDFRMASHAAVDEEVLRPLQSQLSESFPRADMKRTLRAEFRVEAGKLVSPQGPIDLGLHGLWLSSQDGTRVVQFRPDGLTFNNLRTYMGGDLLIETALDLWVRFAAIVKPSSVTRVALRYINKLDLPMREGDEFQSFLTASPELPEGAPQKLSTFLSRVIGHDPSGATVVVTQKLDIPPAPPPPLPVSIDVDAFVAGHYEIGAEDLRPILAELRALKNRTFFSLITERAVNLYL